MFVGLSVRRFKFASKTTKEFRPVRDILLKRLSRSEMKAIRASETEKSEGGLGDL